MPATLSYPGVYLEEIPSGVRTITGVATSITAFLGRAISGLVNEPIAINSFGDPLIGSIIPTQYFEVVLRKLTSKAMSCYAESQLCNLECSHYIIEASK